MIQKLTITMLLLAFSLTAQAGGFYQLKTNLGKKLGSVVFSKDDILFNTSGNGNLGTTFFSAGPIREPALQLSRVLSNAESYKRYVGYTTLMTGSDIFVAGAPMYGNVNRTIRTNEQKVAIQKVFSANQVKAEVFEGTQNTLFYSGSTGRGGQENMDAKSCEAYLNLPLWTIRYSNAQGDSIDMIYSGLVSLTNFRDAQKKFFPESKIVHIEGAEKCLNNLKKLMQHPDRVD